MRLLMCALVSAVVFSPMALAADPQGPPLEVSAGKLAAALHCPEAFDDTKNEPVLLVHGTGVDDKSNWSWNYLPALSSLGFDVCTVTLPNYSLEDIQVQTEYVVHAIRQIATRSTELVDIVGASQGTLQPRWAVKWWPDVRASVDDLVFLAGPHHGTEATRLGVAFGRCFPSCWQMSTGSNFLNALNADDETPGTISYTSIYTLFDELVIPQLPESTSALHGATNIAVQDLCPGRPVEHAGLSTADAVGYALTLDAFTHPGPADPERFDISTCAQATMPGADLSAADGSLPNFQGDYVEEEPPLKPYARPSSATQEEQPSSGDDPAPSSADPSPPRDDAEVAVGGESEVSGGGTLPATGMNIMRIVAVALLLVAAGSTMAQARMRSSRSADRRTLPASSRNGSETNS